MHHLKFNNSDCCFHFRIVTFQKKTDATCLCLVFDSTHIEGFQKGAGYHHPGKFTEPPKGLDSFPPIFTYPPVSYYTKLWMFIFVQPIIIILPFTRILVLSVVVIRNIVVFIRNYFCHWQDSQNYIFRKSQIVIGRMWWASYTTRFQSLQTQTMINLSSFVTM